MRPAQHCHLNFVVADTARWEQSATYYLDTHPNVAAFVKNDHLDFTIPYFHDGQVHEYYPDFLVRFVSDSPSHLILETKGYDPLTDVKAAAAARWVAAVNAEGSYGHWAYAIARKPEEVRAKVSAALKGD